MTPIGMWLFMFYSIKSGRCEFSWLGLSWYIYCANGVWVRVNSGDSPRENIRSHLCLLSHHSSSHGPFYSHVSSLGDVTYDLFLDSEHNKITIFLYQITNKPNSCPCNASFGGPDARGGRVMGEWGGPVAIA